MLPMGGVAHLGLKLGSELGYHYSAQIGVNYVTWAKHLVLM